MDAWLSAANRYVDRWIDFQMRQTGQPGCTLVIAHGSEIVHEKSFGVADLGTGERLTPRGRFRTASHSKTFTAAGILKLKEQGRLRLDDSAGSYVEGLHPAIASVTVGQLLSHSGGLSRDGANAGYFADMRPFPSAAQLLDELRQPPVIEAGSRAKYSNHGYALLALIIEAVTQESYTAWIAREIIAAAGLQETTPDMSDSDNGLLVPGHTSLLPYGRRMIIPGDAKTDVFASVTGFVGTASDLARFFAQLSPTASHSILSPQSRRDMTRPQWEDPDSSAGRSYAMGLFCGEIGAWKYFGNVGRFQGSITRTVTLLPVDITVSVLTNAIDGPAQLWVDGIVRILQRFHAEGAPTADVSDWAWRGWNMWGAADFVPVGSRVHVFNPTVHPPFSESIEITPTEPDSGLITCSPVPDVLGESARRLRGPLGQVVAIRVGGGGYTTEEILKTQIEARYGGQKSKSGANVVSK